jgi:hypothetical protein
MDALPALLDRLLVQSVVANVVELEDVERIGEPGVDRSHFIAAGGDGFASKNRQLCA